MVILSVPERWGFCCWSGQNERAECLHQSLWDSRSMSLCWEVLISLLCCWQIFHRQEERRHEGLSNRPQQRERHHPQAFGQGDGGLAQLQRRSQRNRLRGFRWCDFLFVICSITAPSPVSVSSAAQGRLSSSAKVFIKVLDINDNVPRLARDYQPYICEGAQPGDVCILYDLLQNNRLTVSQDNDEIIMKTCVTLKHHRGRTLIKSLCLRLSLSCVFVSLSSFSSSALLIQTSRWKDTISTSPWSPTGTSIPTSPSEIIKVTLRNVYHLYTRGDGNYRFMAMTKKTTTIYIAVMC